MVQLSHVYKTYRENNHILKNLKLDIMSGEFVFLMGPSGAGKTTLFRIMTGFEKSTSGQVIVNDFNLDKITNKEISKFRRTIGVVFQDFKLLYDRSVFENVALPLQILGFHRWDIFEKVEKIIAGVGLSRQMHENPIHLSGGEKQRVAIARALIHQPQLIIADEPTGNLDWQMSDEIMELFKAAHRKGTTVIIATHDHNLVKKTQQKRVIKIESGQIFESGDEQPCGQYFVPLKEAGLSIL